LTGTARDWPHRTWFPRAALPALASAACVVQQHANVKLQIVGTVVLVPVVVNGNFRLLHSRYGRGANCVTLMRSVILAWHWMSGLRPRCSASAA